MLWLGKQKNKIRDLSKYVIRKCRESKVRHCLDTFNSLDHTVELDNAMFPHCSINQHHDTTTLRCVFAASFRKQCRVES